MSCKRGCQLYYWWIGNSSAVEKHISEFGGFPDFIVWIVSINYSLSILFCHDICKSATSFFFSVSFFLGKLFMLATFHIVSILSESHSISLFMFEGLDKSQISLLPYLTQQSITEQFAFVKIDFHKWMLFFKKIK